jgi:hypothetical protein
VRIDVPVVPGGPSQKCLRSGASEREREIGYRASRRTRCSRSSRRRDRSVSAGTGAAASCYLIGIASAARYRRVQCFTAAPDAMLNESSERVGSRSGRSRLDDGVTITRRGHRPAAAPTRFEPVSPPLQSVPTGVQRTLANRSCRSRRGRRQRRTPAGDCGRATHARWRQGTSLRRPARCDGETLCRR